MRKTKKTLAILAIVAMVVALLPVQAFADTTSALPARISGTTQYDTAAEISKQWTTATKAVLAPGEKANLVDALAAGPLAAALDAPILLTDGKTLNANIKAQLTALGVKTLYVTSGTKVITSAVRDQLTAMGITLVDTFGAEAADTSVAIAKAMAAAGVSITQVALANGTVGAQDAMSIASFAGAAKMPILVTDNANTLPASVSAYLASLTGVTKKYVVGGTAVISDAQKAAFGTADRLSGNTAYDTNLAVITALATSFNNVFIANGETLVDALAGAPLAAKKGAAIVLTNGTDAAAASYVNGKLGATSVVTALGGEAVVPAAVAAKVVYTAPPAPATLAVSSVSALNLNQISVVFNKAVDKTTAQTIGNYVLNSTTLAGNSVAKLQSDGVTVIITVDTNNMFGANTVQSTVKTVTVKNVLAKGSYTETVPKTLKDVTFFDSTVPTVSSVSVTGNSEITVKFSEAVKNAEQAARYLLNGSALGAYSGTPSYSWSVSDGGVLYGTTVNIDFTSPLPAGDYTLTVNNGSSTLISDMAGFTVAKGDQKATVADDTTAPKVVSVTGSTNGQVVVMFNKDIQSAPNFLINSGNSTAGAIDSTDKKKITITFPAGTVLAGANLLTVNKDVTDYYGNVLDDEDNFNVAFTAADDTTAPTVEGITVIDDSTLKVTFSELVKSLYGNNTSNYTVKDASGTKQTLASAVTANNSDNTKSVVTITSAAPLANGEYSIKIANIVDLSDNAMTAVTLNFNASDTTAPTVSGNALYTAANEIVVTFSEAMDTGTIGDRNNFYYSTNGGASYSKFPSNVTASFSNSNKTVTYLFGNDKDVTTFTNVRIIAVKDGAGNAISGAVVDVAVSAATAATFNVVNTSSDYPKSYMASSTKLTVEFNTEQALITYVPANFTVNAQTPDQVVVSGKNVKLNFTTLAKVNSIKGAGSAADLVVVNTNNKDTYGRSLNTVTITSDDEIAPELAATPVAVTDGQTVTVTFNEVLDDTIVGAFKDGFTVSVNGTPKTIHDSTIDGTKKIVSLNFSTKVFDNGNTVTVTPITPSTVKDANGNAYAPVVADDTTSVTVAGFATNITAAAVVRLQGAAAGAATAGVYTITFAGAAVTAADVISIDGQTFTAGAANNGTTFDATTTATINGNATALATAIPLNATLNAKYTVTNAVPGQVTLTQKAGQESATAPAVLKSLTGAATATLGTTTPGVAAVPAVTETASYQITHGADNTKTITVTLTNPALGPVNVTVTGGMTATQVANAIKTALTTAGVTGFTVTAPSDTVIFTSTSAGTDVADLTMSLGSL